MLFFMGSSAHMSKGLVTVASPVGLGIIMLIILLLEANAIFGKQGPLTTVKGVISCSIGLTAVLYGLMALL